MPTSIPAELVEALRKSLQGELRFDAVSRKLYSTDASIYQIEPLGVVIPKSKDDLIAAIELAGQYKLPLLARGAGSSLAGQAIGPGLIIDVSQHLHHILSIDPQKRTATAQPGANLTAINRLAAQYGLMFGPDPASADRATLGGSVANNATGAHSIVYGMAADHLLEAEVIFSDGSMARLAPVPLDAARKNISNLRPDQHGAENRLYAAALDVIDRHSETVRRGWPKVWRRASGYNLNYLLPWSPSAPPMWDYAPQNAQIANGYPPIPPDHLNLAPLLAGSEGTLAIMSELEIRLVPRPKHTLLLVLTYQGMIAACQDTPRLLEYRPHAIELVSGALLRLSKTIPAYARLADLIPGDPNAMLFVEFAGDDLLNLKAVAEKIARHANLDAIIAETPAQQKQLWDLRKMGLGIVSSRPGRLKPIAIVEDLAVPVDQLGHFVVEMERIFAAYGTTGDFYAHASAGCLHIRPLLDLHSAGGRYALRSIATQAVDLILSLGGAVSGEHGDGIARSEWMEKAFGVEITQLFRNIKRAADPHNLMNPGKILDAPSLESHLRYTPEYRVLPWETVLSFHSQDGIDGAIEMCNGAGVCRKEGGLMCPSFQATGEEMHSTRGRANLMRFMITGQLSNQEYAERAVFDALDLCLACKGCKSECPSGVDVAKLKYEFTHRYYQKNPRRLRDYLFANIGTLAALVRPLAPVANSVFASRVTRALLETGLGLDRRRIIPAFSNPYSEKKIKPQLRIGNDGSLSPHFIEKAIMLSDAFSRYFHPETERSTLEALHAAGVDVITLPLLGAGRTFISKGMLDHGKRHASRVIDLLRVLDPHGELPVVGIEPSEIYTLRDEYLDLFPYDSYVQQLAQRSWMVDEFLIRPGPAGMRLENDIRNRTALPGAGKKVLLHGHCYQKALPPAPDGMHVGVEATLLLLRTLGYEVTQIQSGCCGMAGAFGYESEHYDLSMSIGELSLFPEVRAAASHTIIAAPGTSCRSQIHDGVGRTAFHPITLQNSLSLQI